MRSQEESAVKRDAEATRHFNETDDRISQPSFEQEHDSERQEFEEERFEEEQLEEEEDIGAPRADAEDEEAELLDSDNEVRKSVGHDEVEQELMESSSDSWESGDEDDDVGGERNVTVVRETAADIPVSRLVVVPDSDRRKKQQSTKMSSRGHYQLLSLTSDSQSLQSKQRKRMCSLCNYF